MARKYWQDDALCQNMEVNIFYGYDEKPMTSKEIKIAKSICYKCEVRKDCLITALRTQEPHGVWGGFTSFERKASIENNVGHLPSMIDDYENNTFIKPRKRRK